jgi:hypothetical protein
MLSCLFARGVGHCKFTSSYSIRITKIFSQIDANNQFSPETLVEKANEIMDDDDNEEDRDAEVSVIKEMAEKCRGTFHVDRLAKEKFQHFLSFDYFYYFHFNIKV